jgi:hypothetical protein
VRLRSKKVIYDLAEAGCLECIYTGLCNTVWLPCMLAVKTKVDNAGSTISFHQGPHLSSLPSIARVGGENGIGYPGHIKNVIIKTKIEDVITAAHLEDVAAGEGLMGQGNIR